MSAPTKAQLAAENAALRAKVSQLGVDLERTELQTIDFASRYSEATTRIDQLEAQLRAERGEKPVPQFLRAALPAHMQRAKDMAMRAGITVKVSS